MVSRSLKRTTCTRTYEFDVKNLLKPTGNELTILFDSPTRTIRERDLPPHAGGSDECMKGFPNLRKAHCMFGWDWGPRLPDAGILASDFPWWG